MNLESFQTSGNLSSSCIIMWNLPFNSYAAADFIIWVCFDSLKYIKIKKKKSLLKSCCEALLHKYLQHRMKSFPHSWCADVQLLSSRSHGLTPTNERLLLFLVLPSLSLSLPPPRPSFLLLCLMTSHKCKPQSVSCWQGNDVFLSCRDFAPLWPKTLRSHWWSTYSIWLQITFSLMLLSAASP